MSNVHLLVVGTHLKFRVPHITRDGIEAEWPWGQVVGVINEHRVAIRVDNLLIASDLHGFYFGDVLELELAWVECGSVLIWQSVGKLEDERISLNS